jgi:quercetin dioxygenase-like cupin family protein
MRKAALASVVAFGHRHGGRSAQIVALWLALVLAATACAQSASPAQGTTAASASPSTGLQPAPASAVQVVGREVLSRPPELPLRMNVGHLMQPPGARATHTHENAFIYLVSGVTRLEINGTPTDLTPGQAAFIPASVLHTHANPGTTPNDWYFLSFTPAAAPLPPPPIKIEYKTPDVATMPSGATLLVLRRLDLPPQTSFSVPGHALQLSYQLTGDVLLHQADGSTRPSKAGDGDFFVGPTPNVTRIDNLGTTSATILVMTLDLPG